MLICVLRCLTLPNAGGATQTGCVPLQYVVCCSVQTPPNITGHVLCAVYCVQTPPNITGHVLCAVCCVQTPPNEARQNAAKENAAKEILNRTRVANPLYGTRVLCVGATLPTGIESVHHCACMVWTHQHAVW